LGGNSTTQQKMIKEHINLQHMRLIRLLVTENSQTTHHNLKNSQSAIYYSTNKQNNNLNQQLTAHPQFYSKDS
jgi:hypothetical protein